RSLRLRRRGRLVLDGLRKVLPAVVTHRAFEFLGSLMQSRLRPVFGRTERRLAIALPVAPAAAAPATSSTPSFARLTVTLCTFLLWLLLTEPVFFGRSAIMVFMRDCVVCHGVLRQILCVPHVFTRLATAAAASATTPAPAPAAAFTFTTFALAAFDSLFGFGGKFGFLEMVVDLNGLVFHFRDGRQLWLL